MTPQAESVLRLNLAKHLACGHLTGIAKESKDLVPILNNECYEVCQNNLCACMTPFSVGLLDLVKDVQCFGLS